MSPEDFTDLLRNTSQRVAALAASGELSHEAALEDLRCTLEELHVADEELRQQNEELAATQATLAEERRRYRELFDLAPDAYIVTDLDGVISEANLAAARLLRIDARFLKGKTLAGFIAPNHRRHFRTLLNSVLDAPPGRTVGFQIQPRRGEAISADLTYSLAYGPDRTPAGIRWLIRDVSDRVKDAKITALNQQLESRIAAQAADLAEARRLSHESALREEGARRAAEASEAQSRHVQKLESIGVLAGGIAHDFNNLLHVVLGNADIALSNLPAGAPARDALEEVVRATLRAADLTRQLLAYSGKGAFVVRHLDLSSEVREMATLLRTAISKQATLVWELASHLPVIMADPTQIRQIVMNLITNASDALGEEGGTITLRTGIARLDELQDQRFSAPVLADEPVRPRESSLVFLEIADSGSGMTPDTLARIFDPFFSTKFEGRGLGLAAVMGIVRSHRGLIRIRTERNAGTVFRVLFPPVPGSAIIPERPSAERSDWRGTGTVLVVEDEEGVREVAERTLQDMGFQTITAEDGRQALKLMKKLGDEMSAVLLDLSMPHMGGAETLRRLRAMRPELPVIMMSGYTEEDVTPQLGNPAPGAIAFIQKPFMADELIEVLRSFVQVSAR